MSLSLHLALKNRLNRAASFVDVARLFLLYLLLLIILHKLSIIVLSFFDSAVTSDSENLVFSDLLAKKILVLLDILE